MADYQRFFDAYVRCFGPLAAVQTEKTPGEMIVRPVEDSKGWVEWKLIPCDRGVMERVLLDIEARAGVSLPGSFKEWYSTYYTLAMDCSVVRLPENASNRPGVGLLEFLMGSGEFSSRPRELGLIPFGDEGMMDAGPICFDARGGGEADGWPIRYWDHEWVGKKKEIGPAIFSSFGKLVEGVTACMEAFAAVKESRPGKSSTWLDYRDECLEALMVADPAGAGAGEGRRYWGG